MEAQAAFPLLPLALREISMYQARQMPVKWESFPNEDFKFKKGR
jgi:hypothetical protein